MNTPCRNGGTCTKLPFGKFKCECIRGFDGLGCERDVEVCSSAEAVGLCKNNGKCVDGIGANFTCVCEPGFTGAQCQIALNLCDVNPCLNGGVCEQTIVHSSTSTTTYKCQCSGKFTGRHCEIGMCLTKVKASYTITILPLFIHQEFEDKCKNYCSNNATCIVRDYYI